MSFESWWNDQDRVRDGENNKKVCKIIWERIEISNHTKIKELEKRLELAIDALRVSADSGSICSKYSEKALKKIEEGK